MDTQGCPRKGTGPLLFSESTVSDDGTVTRRGSDEVLKDAPASE
jgi:hypothetical protein